LEFQVNSWLWGGPGFTDTLTIDNLILTQVRGLVVTASANASTFGSSVTFTATVQTNGVPAGDAVGQIVFSSVNGPFSTNTLIGGGTTSSVINSLPAGMDPIIAIYSGGNYPSITNSLNYLVTALPQDNLPIYTDNLVDGFQNWSWATINLGNTDPVHSGICSISVTDGGNSQALAFEHPQFNTTPYTNLSFWINGGCRFGDCWMAPIRWVTLCQHCWPIPGSKSAFRSPPYMWRASPIAPAFGSKVTMAVLPSPPSLSTTSN
jgi:hypothetical protein